MLLTSNCVRVMIIRYNYIILFFFLIAGITDCRYMICNGICINNTCYCSIGYTFNSAMKTCVGRYINPIIIMILDNES